MQSTRAAAAFAAALAAADGVTCWPWGAGAGADTAERSGAVYAFGRHFGRYPSRVDGVPDAVAVAVRDELGAAIAADGKLHAFTSDGAVEQIDLAGRARATAVAVRGTPQQIVAVDEGGTVHVVQRTDDGFDAPRVLRGALRRARVDSLACGEAHCVAVGGGAAFAWGSDSHGQLGRAAADGYGKADDAPSEEPRRMRTKAKVVSAACGDAHTALLDASGGVHTVGDDRWAQLGRTAEPWLSDTGGAPRGVVTRATLIDDLPVKAVAAGGQHTAVLVRDGTLFTFGYNLYGQLAHHNVNSLAPPSPTADILLRASAVAAGSNATCVLGEDGELRCIGAVESLKPSAVWQHPRPRGVKGRLTYAHALAQGGDACAFVADER